MRVEVRTIPAYRPGADCSSSLLPARFSVYKFR
jgi:hypothetical protein